MTKATISAWFGFAAVVSLVAAAAAQQRSGLDDAPLGGPTPSATIAKPAATPAAADAAVFSKADLNGDGVLSGKEAKDLADYADGDGDGRISRAEFVEVRAREKTLLASTAQRREAEQAFRSRDVSEDGMLTGTESKGFAPADVDGSGGIDLEEFVAFKKGKPAAETYAGTKIGGVLGGELGGTIGGGGEAPNDQSSSARRLEEFGNLDGNEDGRLSGSEMKSLEKFDADRNGRITRDEYLAGADTDDKLRDEFEAGKLQVVLIGVSGYKDRPLPCATPDVRFVLKALSETAAAGRLGGKYSVDDFDDEKSYPKRAFVSKLPAEVLKTVGEADTVVLYFVVRLAATGDGVFLCPLDYDATQPLQTGVAFSGVVDALATCRAKHKLLCVAGCPYDESQANSADELSRRLSSSVAYVPNLTTMIYVVPRSDAMTAPGRAGGLLADALSAALRGKANFDDDGFVSADELCAYVKAAVAHAARTSPVDVPREPWYVTGPGDGTFALTRVKLPEPATDVAKSDALGGKDSAADPQRQTNEFVNSVGMKFVYFAPSQFLVGSPEGHAHRKNDEEMRTIKRTFPLYFGCHEVTQGQYSAVMGEYPSHHSRAAGYDDRYPVEQVSWIDANEFCKRLSNSPEEVARERAYRLPTECEWEQACGADDAEKNIRHFHTGMTITSEQANIRGDHPLGDSPTSTFLNRTQPVGSYPPNKFGLYDMHGNVAEWCLDWYVADRFVGNDPLQTETDFVADKGTLKSVRGGDFLGDVAYCRAAARRSFDPEYRYKSLGFRVVCYRPQSAVQK